jgi:hypothetical protein
VRVAPAAAAVVAAREPWRQAAAREEEVPEAV